MSLPKKIGRYEVKSLLGSGGMGEVYLAHDSSLGREVAVKVLLPEFCCNLERVNRFKLEAKATSGLNHPSIITIHEIGEDDSRLYIVTEFIKGETLRSLIEREVLTVSSALNFAEQIASALTVAHQAGIIHRDIKPENIMIREDGIVKILDFGLAKPTQVESEAETRELVATKAGLVMGSIAYMSPEQSRGKEVDTRTDLWSLGVVLYEMLAGKSPFDDETMTDILANIIHKEPKPLADFLDDVPSELQRIVKKSLKKDREERYQNSKDFSLDLKNLRRELELEHELEFSISPNRLNETKIRSTKDVLTDKNPVQATDEVAKTQILSNQTVTAQNSDMSPEKPKTRKVSMFFVAIFGFLGLLVMTALSYFQWQAPSFQNKFDNISFEKLPIKGKLYGAKLSPDGKYIVYAKTLDNDKIQIILRQTATGSEKDILPIENATLGLVGFSPDSNYLYFQKAETSGLGSSLYRVPTLGGEPSQIAFDVDSGVSFSPDGSQIVFHRHQITPSKDEVILVNSAGGEEKIIYTSNETVLSPRFSPDGSKILLAYFDKTKGVGLPSLRLAWINFNGGNLNFIGQEYFSEISDFQWLKDGSGIVVAGIYKNENSRQIFLTSFPFGEVSRITKDSNDYYGTSLTNDNNSILTIQANLTSSIWEYDLTTKQSKQISATNEEKKGISSLLAANDESLFFSKSDGKENLDLWHLSLTDNRETPIIKQKGENRIRQISNDGKYIFYEAIFQGSDDIKRALLDGSNQTNITESKDFRETILAVLPDNKTLLFREQSIDSSKITMKKINTETGEISTVYENDKTFFEWAFLSPDGKHILYVMAPINFETGIMPQSSLYYAPFDGQKIGEARVLEKVNSGKNYRFSPDGKTLYFTPSDAETPDVWKFDIASGKKSKVTDFNHETIFRFAVSPSGKKLFIVRGNSNRDIVLIKNN